MKRPLFASPYDMLPYAVFGFIVLCFSLHPFSPFFTHHFADPDDYMRLNQVAAWLQGQGWYDLSVPRMSPGANTVIHWSRLIDVPIALFALPFIPHFGVLSAVLISSFLVPLTGLAVLFALLVSLAKPFVGRDRAKIACVMALFAPLLLFCFTPGRVDHHGAQVLIAGFGLLSLAHIILDNKSNLFAALVGLALSFGFWIGAEILPWAIVFILCLGVAAVGGKKSIARSAAIFGACLFLFTAALVPIALPKAEFCSRALSWFSPVYAIFAALSGSVFVAGWGIGQDIHNKAARFSLYALLGLVASGVFVALVPDALIGPFADYNSFDATKALDNIFEAQPLMRSLHVNRFMPATLIPACLVFFRLLFLPLVALFVCFHALWRGRAELRSLWLVQGVFLLAAIILSVFWQLRIGRFMEFFSIVPLTYLLVSWWDKLRGGLRNRPLFWAEIVVFLLLGPLPVVFLPAVVHRTSLYPDVVLFPAARKAPSCAMESVIPFLNDPDRLGSASLTIMNTGDTGPQILFSTQHRVIAGNFNISGNADAYSFFSSLKDADAKAAAKKWAADLVLICRTAPTLYLGKDYYAPGHGTLLPGKDGLLHFTNTNPSQPLIQRLIRGQNPPWLKPIEIFGPSDYLLFRIIQQASKR